MSWETIATIIGAVGGPTTVAALYKWARAQGRADALADQAKRTIAAKDVEIAELKAENERLWAMLEALTTPPEGS